MVRKKLYFQKPEKKKSKNPMATLFIAKTVKFNIYTNYYDVMLPLQLSQLKNQNLSKALSFY